MGSSADDESWYEVSTVVIGIQWVDLLTRRRGHCLFLQLCALYLFSSLRFLNSHLYNVTCSDCVEETCNQEKKLIEEI
jgi:hypothetical protein